MKKIISILLCVVLLSGAVSLTAFAGEEKNKSEETEFVLEIDVNKRYTDIAEDTDGVTSDTESKNEISGNQKTIYIAVLCAALVVSVVVLAVSIKRVPKEDDIDISGQNKVKKNNKE